MSLSVLRGTTAMRPRVSTCPSSKISSHSEQSGRFARLAEQGAVRLRGFRLAAFFVAAMAILWGTNVPAAAQASGQVFGYRGGENTRSLVTSIVDETRLTQLSGNTPGFLSRATDLGAVSDNTPVNNMQLQLQRPAELETELEKLMEEQQTKSSPNYHKWLTAAEFGRRFGPAQQDIQSVTSWLQNHGFIINSVAPSGMVIEFSGNVGQIKQTFHTEIHNITLDGEIHFSNVSDPQIPQAFSGIVKGVHALHNFLPHPMMHKVTPDFNVTLSGSNYQAVAPADLATIYNFNPAFSAGYKGAGQTVVVIEDTLLANISDVNTFRSNFGLNYPYTFTQSIVPGTTACSSPGVNGDESEAALDAEWASAAAPEAAIKLAACKDTATVFGGLIALQNLINGASPPSIVSISYGECESANGAAANASYLATYQQAAAEGVSVFVSSGDSGAASCDQNRSVATHGITVSGFASTPYNVAVGGTDFADTYESKQTSNPVPLSTYWSSTNDTNLDSALSYIPEIPWNDSCAGALLYTLEGYTQAYGPTGFCNSATGKANFRSTAGGSGGPSNYSHKPSWQSVFGNPSDTWRDIPDVSLFAANGLWNHFYIYCMSDTNEGGAPCDITNETDLNSSAAGGTSFAAPIMAGVQALINQKWNSSQGNPAPNLYTLAGFEYGSSGSAACDSSLGTGMASNCVFNDITLGDNAVNCTGTNCFGSSGSGSSATQGVLSTSTTALQPAYAAGTGWDFATGLGSVNVSNLVNWWEHIPTTLAITPSATPIIVGQSVTFTATLSAPFGSGESGNVTWSSNTGCAASAISAAVATCTTSALPLGNGSVTATYAGDFNYAGSTNSLNIDVMTSLQTPTVTVTPLSIIYGTTAATLTAGIGYTGGTAPTGAVSIQVDGGTTLTAACTGSSSPLTCTVSYTTAALALGSHTITASIASDTNFAAASNTATLAVVAASYTAPTENVGTASGTQTATIAIFTAGTPATISVLTQGATGLDFKLVSGGTCSTSTPYNVADTCTVEYTFTPAHPGSRYGGITLIDGSGNLLGSTYLNGTGTGPQIIYQPGTQVSLGGGFNFPAGAGLAVDSSGNTYVVDGSSDDEIFEIPAGCGTSACVQTLGGTFGFNQPDGVAVDGIGNVFVADTQSNAVEEMPAGCTSATCVTTLATGINQPNGIAVDGAGNVYTSNQGDNTVTEILSMGGAVSASPTINTLGGGFNFQAPDGIAIDGGGNIYVADDGNNAVKEIPPGCTTAGCVITLGGGFGAPQGVAVDGIGNIYVADPGFPAFDVDEMPAGCKSSSCVTQIVPQYVTPFGIALDPSGNLYLAYAANDNITESNFSTIPSLSFGTPTAVGSTDSADGAQSFTITNDGNANLTIAKPSSGTNPNISSGFAYKSGSSCPQLTTSNSAYNLASNASCTYSVNFKPAVAGSNSGTLVLTDNNLNGNPATQTINLSGTGNKGTPTWGTLTFGVSSPQVYGFTAPVTISDTLSFGGVLPTGQVSFVVAGFGTLYPTCVGTTSPITCSIAPPNPTVTQSPATFTITPTVAADSNYNTASGTAGSLTINQQTPTLSTVSFSPVSPLIYGTNQAVTLSSTLSYTGGGNAPTGTVSILFNSISHTATCTTASATSLTCTATVPASKVETLAVASYPASVSYAGDTNYKPASNSGTSFSVTKQTPTFGTMNFSPVASEPYGTSQAITVSDTLIYVGGGAAPTGAVTFNVNAQNYPATCTTGASPLTCTATIPAATIAATSAGIYNVAVTYTADTDYAGATGSIGTFTVVAPPSISTSFGAASVALNGSPVAMSFTITNPNAATALTGISFIDFLPSGLVVSTPNGLTGSCGGGTITASAGSSSVLLNGSSIAGSSSCTFSVNVSATAVGVLNNSTANVNSTNGGAGNTASASITAVSSSYTSPATQLGTSTTQTAYIGFANNFTFGQLKVVTQGITNLDYSSAGTTCLGTYTSGQSCSVTYTFAPTAPGQRQGAILIYDNSPTPVLEATVYLNGIGLAPLAVVYPGTQSKVGTGLAGPNSIALDGAGNVYIADTGNVRVRRIPASDPTCSTPSDCTNVGTGLSNPTQVAVDGAGNVYISDYFNSNSVYKVPATDLTCSVVGDCKKIATNAGGLYPAGLAVDGSGNVYMVDPTHAWVLKIPPTDPTCATAGDCTHVVTGLSGANSVAVDASGNFYVTAGSHLLKVPPSDPGCTSSCTQVASALTAPALSAPTGVALDSAGNIYITDTGNGRVLFVPATDLTCATAGDCITLATGINAPTGISVSPSGKVYIAGYGSPYQVLELDGTGVPTLTYSTSTVEGSLDATDDPLKVTLFNIGNQGLSISSAPNPVFPSGFLSDATTTCSASSTLAVSSTCTYGVDFKPTSVGANSGSLVLTDNSLNVSGATQTISLSGTGLPNTTKLAFGTAPAVNVAWHGNGGSAITVLEESAASTTVTTATDSITLTVTGPAGFTTAVYGPTAAVNGVATFDVSGAALTIPGSYTYTATFGTLTNAVANENVAAPVITISPTSLAALTVGVSTNQTLSGSGAVSPYSYQVTVGSLPVGLSINTTSGAITGTPTAGGSYSFTVKATDSSTTGSGPYSGTQSYSGTVAAPTITVSPTTLTSATVGASYSQSVSASGGTASYSYAITAGALPAGLTLSTGGALFGTPTAGGAFNFTITATDSSTGTGPYTGSRAYSLTVNAPTILVAPTSIPNATIAASYSRMFTATGGTSTYSYAVTAGSLPAGLTLSSGGSLSGTPTAGGTFNFMVTATDSSTGAGPYTGSSVYTLTVSAPTILVAPAALLDGAVAAPYSRSITASGGTSTYTFSVTAGILPAGLSLGTNGVLTGTPTAGGTFNFTITATDSSTGAGPYSGSRPYSITVAAPAITVSPLTLPGGTYNSSYSQSLAASGGTSSYSFTVTSGALPPGLTVNSAGVLSGTPSAAGNYNFTVTATDSSTGTGPYSGSRAYSVSIAKAGATVTLGSLNQTYTGSALAATATTNPTGLNVTFTYNGSATAPTTVGSYAVVGTINDPNYLGSNAGTLTISKATATVTLGSLAQTYTGSPLAATATTSPTGLNVTFTYNGSAIAPSAAGSYTVVGTVSDSNYQGSNTGTLVIGKATATVTLGSLSQTYTGSALAATATTNPTGLTVNLSYNGSSTAPTAAGSYNVVGTISDSNYQGSNTGTLVISKATAIVTLGSLSQTYTGSALAATATTNPTGLTVNFSYNGSPTAPTAAGSYTVVGTINDANYQGLNTGTLVIGKATATVTLGSLNQTYSGSGLAATATTNPTGLNVTFTYYGSAIAPSAAGSYNVVGTINDANYQGSNSGTLVIGKATATVTLGSLSQTYTGSALAATAATNPTGLTVNLSYNGSPTAPTAAGSYTVVGTINDANYQGSNTGTLVIGKATTTVTLGSLNQTYSGSGLAATATTNPTGLTVNLSYNGSPIAPTAVGSYNVLGTINDANYQGSNTGTLVIGKATATVTLGSLNQTYSGSGLAATATTNPTGLNVLFTYNGGAGTPTAAGSYTVVGTINDSNYQGLNTGTLVIGKATATVTIGSLSQTYTGSPLAATATTNPTGLNVTFTYNGSPTAPTAAGSYAVVGTISDANYQGSNTGTLVIGKATTSVMLGSLNQNYTGSALVATAITNPPGLAVNLTYNGSATAPTAAGSYTVVGTIQDSNYQGSSTGTLVIGKVTGTVTIASLNQTYTGSPLPVTSITSPAGLNVTYTYNGIATAPTAAGSYAVVATMNDPNYQGSNTGALVIGKAATSVILVSGTNPVLLQSPVTFTATVSSTAGAPTGTVTFLDGSTPIGTGTVAGGIASFTTSTLAVNSHTITASYGGDPNFATFTSNAVTQSVINISVGTPGNGGGTGLGIGGSQTVLPGGVAVFTLPIAPTTGPSFPVAVTLTISGLPTGVVATVAPTLWVPSVSVGNTWTLPANTPLPGNTTLSFKIPQTVSVNSANQDLGKRMAPLALALLLLPFAGRLRRVGKRMGRTLSVLLLLAASLVTVAGLAGCGANSGFFTQGRHDYPVTVTLSSGSLSQATALTLTVE